MMGSFHVSPVPGNRLTLYLGLPQTAMLPWRHVAGGTGPGTGVEA